jgi:hypothetical protein
MQIKEASFQVMDEAYMHASGDGELPANPRQIMYAARPEILTLTGRKELDDAYFTQKMVPAYLEEYPDETESWVIAYDARGHFIEPHTGLMIGLGTLEVLDYLQGKITRGPAAKLDCTQMYPTHGPLYRYKRILFIEKEGFMSLFESRKIAQRFDLGIMSTKGMSVTAARKLLDELTGRGNLEEVLVLHDFDVSGFSIFGTLFNDTWRYKFQSKVKVIDLGFRLADITGIDREPYRPFKGEDEDGEKWDKRVETLERHGATEEEIEILETHRVELNAMTAPQFMAWLEPKLAKYCPKVVPPSNILEAQARRIWTQQEAEKRCSPTLKQIEDEAPTIALPADLEARVHKLLEAKPELPWDLAVAEVMKA